MDISKNNSPSFGTSFLLKSTTMKTLEQIKEVASKKNLPVYMSSQRIDGFFAARYYTGDEANICNKYSDLMLKYENASETVKGVSELFDTLKTKYDGKWQLNHLKDYFSDIKDNSAKNYIINKLSSCGRFIDGLLDENAQAVLVKDISDIEKLD